jgi:colicin import membrane protein
LAEQARQDVERQKAQAERDLKEENERAEKAAQAERDKIAAEQKAEAEAIAKREADLNHKKTINGEILNALCESCLIGEVQAKQIISAIVTGKIPHIKINY